MKKNQFFLLLLGVIGFHGCGQTIQTIHAPKIGTSNSPSNGNTISGNTGALPNTGSSALKTDGTIATVNNAAANNAQIYDLTLSTKTITDINPCLGDFAFTGISNLDKKNYIFFKTNDESCVLNTDNYSLNNTISTTLTKKNTDDNFLLVKSNIGWRVQNKDKILTILQKDPVDNSQLLSSFDFSSTAASKYLHNAQFIKPFSVLDGYLFGLSDSFFQIVKSVNTGKSSSIFEYDMCSDTNVKLCAPLASLQGAGTLPNNLGYWLAAQDIIVFFTENPTDRKFKYFNLLPTQNIPKNLYYALNIESMLTTWETIVPSEILAVTNNKNLNVLTVTQTLAKATPVIGTATVATTGTTTSTGTTSTGVTSSTLSDGFKTNCSYCHGKQAEGGVGPKLMGYSKPVATFIRYVRTGSSGGEMPPFSTTIISDAILTADFTVLTKK